MTENEELTYNGKSYADYTVEEINEIIADIERKRVETIAQWRQDLEGRIIELNTASNNDIETLEAMRSEIFSGMYE